MLNVQQFLQTKTLDQLTDELAIKVTRHDTLALAILNYNQIDSPKLDPIVRECRGLVLNYATDDYPVVARSFPRFFNWGEVQEEMPLFDFSDFAVQSKEDGSLALFYYFGGQWRVNTRGSFAQDNMQHQDFTWSEAIGRAMAIDNLARIGNQNWTYVCEFCSPWNKIVRRYEEPTLYLLTIIDKNSGEEIPASECDTIACLLGIRRPTIYQFTSIEEIQEFLQEQGENDPTFEGVVIRDKDGRRWKIKSATYLGLHRLRGEDDVWNPKHLIPFILAGEEDELITYFPEVKETYFELKSKVLTAYVELLELWGDHWRIEDQKEFALKVKDTPLSSILFSVRKFRGERQTSADIREEWKKSDRIILNRFGKSK